MKRHSLYLLLFLSVISLTSIGTVRKALLFDTKIAYASNEPWFGWMMIGSDEVQILFETALSVRELSVREFCRIYGFSDISGSKVMEQWCSLKYNSLCEMRYVGDFLYHDGGVTKLPVVPEYMYY